MCGSDHDWRPGRGCSVISGGGLVGTGCDRVRLALDLFGAGQVVVKSSVTVLAAEKIRPFWGRRWLLLRFLREQRLVSLWVYVGPHGRCTGVCSGRENGRCVHRCEVVGRCPVRTN